MDKPQVCEDRNNIDQSSEVVRVAELKLTLEDVNLSSAMMLSVLSQLDPCLSARVLKETGVGKTVNKLAKSSLDTNVRSKATELVAEWKRRCLKQSSDNANACKRVRLSSDVVTSGAALKADQDRPSGSKHGPDFSPCERTLPAECVRADALVSKSEISPSEFLKKMRALKPTSRDSLPLQRTLPAPSAPKPISKPVSDSRVSQDDAERMQRRTALRNGGQVALLTEVERFLRENGRRASMNVLNSHIASLWSQYPTKVVIDKGWHARGPDGPPIVGRNFVERNGHILELKEKFKSTKGSKKGFTKGYHIGCEVRLKRK